MQKTIQRSEIYKINKQIQQTRVHLIDKLTKICFKQIYMELNEALL